MADRRARERTPIPRAEVEYLKHLDRLDYDPSLPDWDELSAAERAHWENLYPEAQDGEQAITHFPFMRLPNVHCALILLLIFSENMQYS